MFSRMRLLCIRQSPIQLQTSTRHFSSKGPVSIKRPQADSVKTRLPPSDTSKSTKSRKHRSHGLDFFFLDSYNISLNQARPLEFFGLQELPQPSVDQELLSNVDAEAMQQDCNKELIHLLDYLVMMPRAIVRVAQFTAKLFKVIGYLDEDRIEFQWMDLPLVISGEPKCLESVVCMVDMSQNEILLVAQEDKMTEPDGLHHARTQLVAAAVAAFNQNNLQREKDKLPPLAEKVIPGVVMAGTSPSFFKIPVTETLSSHIYAGTYPPCETCISYCYNTVPALRRHEGLKPLDNRLKILKCYEAFKVFVGK